MTGLSTRERDALERVAVAFVEGFVSGVVITQATDRSMWWAATAAGVSGALSVVKSIIATRTGTGSASLSTKV